MSRIRIATLLVLAGLLAAAVVMPRLRPPAFHGTDLGSETPAREFTLTAADRGAVSLSDFRGRTAVLFFGYTSCPDICPLTMSKLARAMEMIGEQRAEVQVLLVTVDPTVDTPARLQEYVRAFDPNFLGLHGDEDTLREVAGDFGAWGGEPQRAERAGASADHEHGTERLIPHSSYIFGVDREGRLRVLWNGDHTAEQLADDLRALLRL